MSNNMQNLKIYDIIDQLEDLIENSPKPKLSGSATKRTVDVEEVFDLLGDLKTTIPEDIRRANSLMIEAQNTIDSANAKYFFIFSSCFLCFFTTHTHPCFSVPAYMDTRVYIMAWLLKHVQYNNFYSIIIYF